MRRIVWSDVAKKDLREALAWHRRYSRRTALRAEVDILNMVAAAAQLPFAGRADPVLGVRLRSLPKWHRRLAYRLEGDDLRIVSIKDTRQEQK